MEGDLISRELLKFPGTPNEDIFDCHNCGGAMYSVGREF
jgi:hypothetical protein